MVNEKISYLHTTIIFIFIQGSCCSSSFGNNISNYLTHMLDLTDMVTRPGSLTYEVKTKLSLIISI
jgi:hypothetical protein